MNETDTSAAIEAARAEAGKSLLILGHHYQHPTVLAHADALGDSLELARRAAAETEAARIVFCGVRFMAETADVLTGGRRTVFMPVPRAGCPMADMAGHAEVEHALLTLGAAGAGEWIPVVYVNSSAQVKAVCGRAGGSACTSSNAERVCAWALGQGRKVLFLPDEHLGRNTAADLGLRGEEVALYDPMQPAGGVPADAMRRARMMVWRGYCRVHTRFTAAHVADARARWPGCRLIVHPETPREVLRLADAHGSTSRIIAYVRGAPDGTTVVVGTEVNLVDRLAAEQSGRVAVKALSRSLCGSMAMTTEASLLRVLREWPADCEVHVEAEVARDARAALERMLSL